MKKCLLTLGLISLTTLSHAQGTIAFGNSALTRIQVCDSHGLRNATAADGLSISVWFGPANSGWDALTKAGTAQIGSTAGVMTGASSVFALAGTEPNQVVSLQIRAEGGGGYYAETRIAQVTLGPTAGPGAVIWQTTTGTNPNRFTPLVPICPEPSTIALGALGCLTLLFRVRKS